MGSSRPSVVLNLILQKHSFQVPHGVCGAVCGGGTSPRTARELCVVVEVCGGGKGCGECVCVVWVV